MASNRLLKITKVFLCDISNVVLINAFKKLVVFTSHLFLVNNRIDLKSKVTYLGISFVLVTLVIGFLINRFDINPALLSRLDLFSGKSSELVLDHDRGGNGRIGVLGDYIKLIESDLCLAMERVIRAARLLYILPLIIGTFYFRLIMVFL